MFLSDCTSPFNDNLKYYSFMFWPVLVLVLKNNSAEIIIFSIKENHFYFIFFFSFLKPFGIYQVEVIQTFWSINFIHVMALK